MTQAPLPQEGRTVLAHVQAMLAEAACVIAETGVRVQGPRRIGPAERDQLRRDLAGVIAHCESVRLWLDAGAPR